MRILHVLPTRASEYGGPVRIAENLCASLAREGHAVEIFPAPEPAATPKRAAYWPGVRALRLLRASVHRAQIVHVHGLWTVPTSAAALFARSAGLPYIVTAHGMLDRWSLARSAGRKRLYAAVVERRNLEGAAAIQFNSHEERQEAQSFGIRAPTFLLPNGADVEQFRDLPGRDALWRRYPETAHKQIVLFLARLHPKKGLPLLVDAFARVAVRRRDVQLVIAGPDEGGHRAEIEALVAARELGGQVLFTGPVAGEHKRMLLGAADVFVLPSYQEGDSVAVKEALAAGLPVIITHPCRFPEVAEARAGYVVNPVVNEIESALERLCVDDELRTEMAANARPLIERYYRWDVLGRQLAARYEEVLSRQDARHSVRRDEP